MAIPSSCSATPEEIARAAGLLLAGELAAFPTETVYGLGADAENPQAVAKIYAAKGRPSNHPVIVHIAPGADVSYWAAQVPAEARLLMDAFWPGPLTLILKRAPHIADTVSGGQDSIGLRCPSHPVAQALLAAFAAGKSNGQGGVAAPSANKFGQVSPTLAEHVRAEFPDEVTAGMPVLEGGASEVGIESTILDLSRLDQGAGPVLLRPGHVSAAQIEAVLGAQVFAPDAAAPRASVAVETSHLARPIATTAPATAWTVSRWSTRKAAPWAAVLRPSPSILPKALAASLASAEPSSALSACRPLVSPSRKAEPAVAVRPSVVFLKSAKARRA